MKAIYKSEEGRRLVLERYQAFLKYWPVPNEQVRVATSQGETFVVVSGPEDAPALLLLHGGAMNSSMWMADVAMFARLFRVYCVDMIGEAGLSAPARPSLASDAHAVWLDDVLNRFGVARVSIVGASLGGWLALDYTIRRPARVERVAVLCPGGVGRQKVGIVFATLLSRLFGKWGRRRLAERVLGRPPENLPPAVKAFVDFIALIHRHFRTRIVRMPVFSDSALRAIHIPVLAIVGGRDVLLDSAQTKRRLEQYVRGAQVVYLPEKGHMIPGQMPRVFEFLIPHRIRRDAIHSACSSSCGHQVSGIERSIEFFEALDFKVAEGPGAWTVDKELNQLGNTWGAGAESRIATMRMQSSASDVPFTLILLQYRGIKREDWRKVDLWDLLSSHIDLTIDGSVSNLLDKLEAANMLVMPKVKGLPNERQQKGFRRFGFVQDPDGLVIQIFGRPVPKPDDPPAPPTVSNSSASGAKHGPARQVPQG